MEDERFVEMATAVSGTGPAYVFLVMEALIDAAVHLGFPRHVAHDLVIETLEGSTAFAKATAQHPAVLRNMVTSPGGTSAAAIHELESGRLRTVLSEAVWASYRRTVELGADLEKGLGLNEGPESRRPPATADRRTARPAAASPAAASKASGSGGGALNVTERSVLATWPPPRGLLAIFAHPDDESYGAGGVMAMAAAAGNPVWVLCATNGDQGGRPGEMDVDHSLDPEIRRRELACACEALGVAEPIFLGYRDSGMEGWGAPEGSLEPGSGGEVVERIARSHPAAAAGGHRHLRSGRRVRPPGPLACSATATAAYRPAAAEPGGPVALYHQALPRSPDRRDAGGDGGGAAPLRRRHATRPRTMSASRRRSRSWPGRTRRSPRCVDHRPRPRAQGRRAGLPRQPDARPALGRSRRRAASSSGCSAARRSCGWIRRLRAGRDARTGSMGLEWGR